MPKPEFIKLCYNLYDLPTAQHKAGLAGLILLIQTMQERDLGPLPEMEISPTEARFVWTSESLQAVFTELYTPTEVEIGKEGDKHLELRPRGNFFKHLLSDDSRAWLKLWQDMVWGVLRSQDKSRLVYKDCLNQQVSPLGQKLWDTLSKSPKMKTELASALFIGAQASNAEDVPFTGTPNDTLLLHFWQVVSLVFAPQLFSVKDCRWTSAGFLIAIPEPSDLEWFIDDIRDLYQRLSPEIIGFRPRQAIIDVPAEGGLEFLYQLTHGRIQRQSLSYSLNAVEIYHLEKQGNNVRLLTSGRIQPDPLLLEKFENLRNKTFNPFFKGLRLMNLLRQNPWYLGADKVFAEFPWSYFVYTEQIPKNLSFFGRDVNQKFQELQTLEETMALEPDDKLAIAVHRLIRTYITRRTEDKSGINLEELPKNEKGFRIYPTSYRETLEKVCSDLFLGFRSRRDHDFVEYFTGTLGAYPQWLPEDDYLLITRVLLSDPDQIKTLSMLAVSAISYLPKPSQNNKED